MRNWPRVIDVQWLKETKERLAAQDGLRARLADSVAFDEDRLRALDSALKKTTTFMKKLKALTGASVPSLISELAKLNLSQFVDEMAQAVFETKMKASEVNAITELCLEISARYAKFADHLLAEIKKCVPIKKSDKITNPAKLRIDIRFLCELILCGVVGKDGLQVLGATLTFLTSTDKTEHINVGLLCSICRSVGWQIAGLTPSPEGGQPTVTLGKNDLSPGPISEQHKKIMSSLLDEYHSALVSRVDKACAEMNVVQKRVKRQERTRGDASAEDKVELEQTRALFDKLKAQCVDLSGALGITMKVMNEEPSDDEEDELAAMEMDKALADGLSMWPDEETRAFYKNILDIRRIVPKNLYKDSEERTVAVPKMQTCMDDVDVEGLELDGGEETADIETETPAAAPSVHETTPERPEPILAPSTEEMKTHMAKFITTMDHLVNRDVTDDAALDFVSNLNTIANRKRLVKLLIGSSATRMDLLPFYARLLAVLLPVMPDVVAEVTKNLIKQFRDFVQRVSAEKERIEEKIKCTIFISELVKFEVIPRAEALSCLRQLVYDFRGHSIEMACALIETAGFYLYRNIDSHPKMKIILDVVLSKRERVKDGRYLMLIDNAYYTCVPPEDGGSWKTVTEPPMKLFVKYLVLGITEGNVDQRIRCLRRIDWTDDQVSEWCLRYLSSPWLVPYSNLPYLASTLAGLIALKHHDWIGIWVVDALVEMIRLSLEVPGVYNQQALACVTYLGELYNYSGCDSSVLYKVLYQLISFPELDDDSWQDFYRIRMVCELLNTVGEFFQIGVPKKKMDYFLTYFMRFFWFKKEQWLANIDVEENDAPRFPADVEAAYVNMMAQVRPGQTLPVDLAEAEYLVEKQEEILKEKMDLPQDEDQEADEEVSRRTVAVDRTLHPLTEEDEEEEFDTDDDMMRRAESATLRQEEEEDKVHVHINQADTQAEDEEFMRELDRIMGETLRNAPTQAPTATIDMSVPASARQRLQRKICFEGDSAAATSSEPADTGNSKPSTKVTLMSRGKGNKAVLKTVSIDEERLHQSWEAEREREKRERADVKRVTLGHTARIIAEEAEEEEKIAQAQNPGSSRKPQMMMHRYK